MGKVTDVYFRIFENVQVQQFPQGARNSAFKVFANLINRRAKSLRSINNEFVYGFTQVLDGEKDPRNLMSAFQIMKSIVENFDISAHVEDIFEVTFCYFPVTFKPPPDDPYGITAEDLKISLRDCLASTPLFAKFALPLILEKLSSTSGSAKVKKKKVNIVVIRTGLLIHHWFTERFNGDFSGMCTSIWISRFIA